MASQIRCRAVGAPIVRSVMDMSLSIDPTRPTIFRCECARDSASVILARDASEHQARSIKAWDEH